MHNCMKKTLFTLLVGCVGLVRSQGAGFVTDFNSGLPANSSIYGNALLDSVGGVNDSGVLKLTQAQNGQAAALYIPDFAGGVAVTNLRVSFKLLIGGGNCCAPERMADGMSLSFANDVAAGTIPNEEGAGTGLIVSFDSWDNAGTDDTAPAPVIQVNVGGTDPVANLVTFQSFQGDREGGRAAAGSAAHG